MKLFNYFVLLFAVLYLVSSLQLTSHKQRINPSLEKSYHRNTYYGKHYRSHRSEEYVQKIKENNLKSIQEFNEKNKNLLKASPSDPSIVTGGSSFSVKPNIFVEFSSEEFKKMFTGYTKSESQAHNKKESHKLTTNQKGSKSNQTESQSILSRHLLHKIMPQHAQQIQSHFQEIVSQNHRQQYQDQDQDWEQQQDQFYDPYEIDENILDSIYGDVNSQQNYGWNYSKLSANYYQSPSQEQDDYWSQWEKNHWGADISQKGFSYDSIDDFWNLDQDWNSDDDGWWNDWEQEENENQDNDDWWNDDDWNNDDWNNDDQNEDDQNNDDQNEDDQSQDPTPQGKTPSGRSIAAYQDNDMEVNWITKKATTHIKQQGICGSCWTYSTVGIVESYFLIVKNTKMDLSQQQLLDCQTKGSYGCDGGFPQLAIKWVTANGLVAEQKYPYKGVQKKCAHPSGPYKIPQSRQVSGRASIEAALRKGPVAASVYVDDQLFPFYEKGIFDKCIAKQPNHAIVIVGFTKDYWIIRNSWGTQWGEQGHMRMKKNQNKNNACSIENQVDVINY